jgi:hypothetical protein
VIFHLLLSLIQYFPMPYLFHYNPLLSSPKFKTVILS